MLKFDRKRLLAVAAEAREEAKGAADRARAYCVPVHRSIEVIAGNGDGRVGSGDPVFLELKELNAKHLAKAVEWLNEWYGDEGPITEISVLGGIDGYESLTDLTNGYDYDPWVEEWELIL